MPYRIKKTVVSFFACVLVAAMSIGCRGASSAPTIPTPTAPNSATILLVTVPGKLSLVVGDTTQIKAIVTLKDHSSSILTNSATWTSSNASVAAVNESGIVTAVGVGSANIVVSDDGVSGTVAVTVAADTGIETRTLFGTVAGPGTSAGTLVLSFLSTSRVSGTLYLANGVISLLGRMDLPTNIVQVIGDGFTFLGTLRDNSLTGTYTDASGAVGGFTALDSTHTAVTAFCGNYSSDGTTPFENPDAGAFSIETTIDGTTSGASVPADAGIAPLTFTGRRDGSLLTMITSQGRSVAGTIQGGSTAGTFETAAGAAATFVATTSACH